jgi:hypothetical protein
MFYIYELLCPPHLNLQSWEINSWKFWSVVIFTQYQLYYILLYFHDLSATFLMDR